MIKFNKIGIYLLWHEIYCLEEIGFKFSSKNFKINAGGYPVGYKVIKDPRPIRKTQERIELIGALLCSSPDVQKAIIIN